MRNLPLLITFFIVIALGVVHGVIVHRWGSDDSLDAAVASLQNVPLDLESWKGQENTIPQQALEIGEIDGYLARSYTNSADGSIVNLMVVCGRPGPISVHTPDICFKGAGYQLVNPYQQHQFRSEQDPSWTMDAFFGDFAKTDATMTQNVRVFWTWSDGTTFSAPDNPRLAFAGQPFLYKIYITHVTERAGDSPDTDAGRAFLKTFMPVLKRELFSEQTSKS